MTKPTAKTKKPAPKKAPKLSKKARLLKAATEALTKDLAKNKEPGPHPALQFMTSPEAKRELQRQRHLEACKKYREKRKRLALGKAELAERQRKEARKLMAQRILETAKAGQGVEAMQFGRTSTIFKGNCWHIDAQTDKDPCRLSFLIYKNGRALSLAIFRAAWKILTGKTWAQTYKDATKKGRKR